MNVPIKVLKKETFAKSGFFVAVLWIRTHFFRIRIRIQKFFFRIRIRILHNYKKSKFS
jgi:hypothetical protein